MTVEVQQLVHGYRNGHRLLAKSVDLTPSEDRIALRMSDRQGRSSNLSTIRPYLTGYRVGRWYGIGCTWAAVEVARPGAVFTHTFLLSDSTVRHLADARWLLPHFRRPNLDYSQQPDLAPVSLVRPPTTPNEQSLSLMLEVANRLYSGGPRPGVVQDADQERLGHAFLAAWSQLWPAARAKFRFCSAPVASRRGAEVSEFDLTGGLDDGKPPTRQSRRSPAIQVLAKDLLAAPGSELRAVLHKYAEGARPETGRGIAELWLLAQHASDSPRLVRGLSRILPGRNGTRMKHDLLGPGIDSDPLVAVPRLGALLSLGADPSFDPADLQLEARSRAWLGKGNELAPALAPLALAAPSSPLKEAIVSGMVDAVARGEVDGQPALDALVELFLRRPEAVMQPPVFARLQRNTVSGLLRGLGARRGGRARQGEIITWILRRDITKLPEPDGASVAAIISALFDVPEAASQLPHVWQEALVEDRHQIIRRLERNAPPIQLLQWGAERFPPEGSSASSPVWLALSETPGVTENLPAAVFLTGLGLAGEKHSFEYLKLGFDQTHQALSHNMLADAEWARLGPFVRKLGNEDGPNRANLLRQAVIAAFVSSGWSFEGILELSKRPTILLALVRDLFASRPYSLGRRSRNHGAKRKR